MIGRTSVAAAASLAIAIATAGCLSFYEIGIETPLQSKLDISPFKRVLVAGFVPVGSKSIDANTETTRLLRSQLRTKSDMKVLDTDVGLFTQEAGRRKPAPPAADPGAPAPTELSAAESEAVDKFFTDTDYWKRVGEELQAPLIVTGTVTFTESPKSGPVSRTKEYIDPQSGVRRVEEVREWVDSMAYTLTSKFVFIDGRTGAQLYSETFKEETSYPTAQNTPALSSYFDLMDKILPGFLNALSSQKIRGTRILLK